MAKKLRRAGYLLHMTLLVHVCSWTSVSTQATDPCLASKAGLDYAGFQSVTKTSKTCVPWSQTPFATSDALFPEKNATAARNYCRNPGYSRATIWCYVNSTSLEFDTCESVSICQSTCRETEAGQEYNGAQPTDSLGSSCLSWASVNRIGVDYFQYDLNFATANTYCRNVPPDVNSPTTLFASPWCFVNSSSPTVSGCSIPFCSQLIPSACRTDRLGQLYRGNVSVTVSGKSCIAWNSSSVYTAANWPVSSETIVAAGSSCRNPNNSTVGLWCFVSATQWEPCIVRTCEPKTSCPTDTQDYYRYRLAQTKTGCQSWSSIYATSSASWYSFTQVPPSTSAVLSTPLFHPAHLPDASLSAAGSYCRNPDNDPLGPWCPSQSGGKLRCSDPCNNVTCMNSQSTPNYIGKLSSTRRGVLCQRWLAKYPWYHNYDTTGNFPDLSVSDASNLCRNPDGNPFGPWCIKSANITDNDFWDFCSVPTCTGVTLPGASASANTAECLDSSFGVTYAGIKSVTGTGRTCQRWDSQSPHPHPYYLAQMFNTLTVSDAANYCRNPSNDTNGPWCFTTDPNVRVEYCNISQCTPFWPLPVEGVLAFIGVLGTHSILLTAIGCCVFLTQAIHDLLQSHLKAKQTAAPQAVEPKIERSSVRRTAVEPKIVVAAAAAPPTLSQQQDGTLDRRMYRRDPQQQPQQQQPTPPHQPPSKFSHNNAVMKAMANTEGPPPPTAPVRNDIWVVSGDGAPGLVGTLQPIREETGVVGAGAIDPQPPKRPIVRDTETLERRLDFDAESLESSSLPMRQIQHQKEGLQMHRMSLGKY